MIKKSMRMRRGMEMVKRMICTIFLVLSICIFLAGCFIVSRDIVKAHNDDPNNEFYIIDVLFGSRLVAGIILCIVSAELFILSGKLDSAFEAPGLETKIAVTLLFYLMYLIITLILINFENINDILSLLKVLCGIALGIALIIGGGLLVLYLNKVAYEWRNE